MYKNCYFYISSGYMSVSKERQDRFFDEIVNLFADNGWEIKRPHNSGECPKARKDKTELYIHPTAVSGNIDMDLKDEIETILKSGNTFRYEGSKEYKEVYDWSDDEYLKYLEENKTAMKDIMLEEFKTKRKNLYIYTDFFSGPLRYICDKFKKVRLTDGMLSDRNLDYRYISELFKELVTSGDLIAGETKSGLCYRTAKNSEKNVW